VQNDRGTFFFLDTHVQDNPSAEQIAEATCQAVLRLKLFGITPKVALLSHSNFGSHENPGACKMRRVLELVRAQQPKLEIDGEMQADSALNEEIRARIFPNSLLRGQANVFVFPNLDAANIAYNMVRQLTDGVAIGPILMGVSKPAHVLTPASTVRRVVNISAIACVEAQIRAPRESEKP
jgi:malate dehydrogenase (oxaloacetate-decarboxylating)(NADP+)